ncbi:MAG: transcription antitermination factor NusB [Bacteroidia bacterium]|nr:transcription antitermination factor NusB [Bacteroidia bacterium]
MRRKVLQTLFAGHLNKESSKKELERDLNTNVDDLLKLYLAQLFTIIKVSEYALIHSAKKADLLKKQSKHTEIVKNSIIIFLQENIQLQDAFDKYEIEDLFQDEDIFRQLFLQWTNTNCFLSYCDLSDRDLQNDKDVIHELVSSIFLKNNALHAELDESLMNVSDDIHLVMYTLETELKDFDGSVDIFTPKVISWNAEKDFAEDLFEKTLDNREDLMSLIDDKLKNWDLDRVAQMDIILMQMAIAELIYFDTIPVKVSINEYIDLSKQFSTPKSKEFINGILDTIMNDLKKAGRINKIGRGLVEK